MSAEIRILKHEDEPRYCTACGKEMWSGYVIDDGEEYYCSDECLNYYYSEREYLELCEEDRAYYTEWFCPYDRDEADDSYI